MIPFWFPISFFSNFQSLSHTCRMRSATLLLCLVTMVAHTSTEDNIWCQWSPWSRCTPNACFAGVSEQETADGVPVDEAPEEFCVVKRSGPYSLYGKSVVQINLGGVKKQRNAQKSRRRYCVCVSGASGIYFPAQLCTCKCPVNQRASSFECTVTQRLLLSFVSVVYCVFVLWCGSTVPSANDVEQKKVLCVCVCVNVLRTNIPM